MMKRILSWMLLLLSMIATASAEQPTAEKYRQMFQAGEFYIEYGVGNLGVSSNMMPGVDWSHFNKVDTDSKYRPSPIYLAVAESQGKRMKGIYGKGDTHGFLELIYEIPKKKTAPDVLFADGKYYRISSYAKTEWKPFLGDTKKVVARAIMLPEDKMGLETLDENEGWNHIRKDLSLPDELAIFYWNDPYRDLASDAEAPHYAASARKTLNKKEYDCDEYVLEHRTASNKVFSKDIYRALYENGELAYVQKFFVRDGEEKLVGVIDIRKITATVPPEVFALPKGTKVYAADEGKMYDLTEQGLLLEEVGK